MERVREPQRDEDLTLGREPVGTPTAGSKTINVRLAQLGAEVIPIIGVEGMTFGQALEKAGVRVARGLELRVNNSTCGLDRVLQDGDILMLVPQIVGGAVEVVAAMIIDRTGAVVDVVWFK